MSPAEWLAAGLNLAYVVLIARRVRAGWFAGIFGALISGWVLYDVQLYLDTLLYLAYALICLGGLLSWPKHVSAQRGKIGVRGLGGRALPWLALGALGSGALGAIAEGYTNASLPYWDAATSVYSLIGTIWQAKRYRENWPLWWVVNATYVGLYSYKGLYVFAALSSVYILLTIDGHRRWRAAP